MRNSSGNNRFVLVAVSVSLIGWMAVGLGTPSLAPDAGTYNEPYRPQLHFTSAKNWMNDPNGLVYYKGEYHLFYQYNPFGDEWGHMSWGHAVSRDMVHWQHLPVALREENGIMIFSGSAVVDGQNSSGFCQSTENGDRSCLVAIYTGHTSALQTQNLAYSNDKGRTWTKYHGNPVIDLHRQDFRDPKVFWHAPTRKWVMVVALPPEHQVRFFGSPDLKHWTALSSFGPSGATGGVWECPDLFQLPIKDERGQARQTGWVLSVNVNPGGEAGGSADQYFVGQFDGTTFVNENPRDQVLWADYGKDFYASTSFSDLPPTDSRRIWMGWLDNWEYAAREPTSPWRGAQSIPRALELKRYAEGLRLVQVPVVELQALRGREMSLRDQSSLAADRWLESNQVRGDTLEIEAEIDLEHAADFGLEVRQGRGEQTTIGINKEKSELFVDRVHSGITGFSATFPGRHAAPLRLVDSKIARLHIFVDRSSVEVFGNDGETVISDRIFPSGGSQGLRLYSGGGEARIVKLRIWNLRSAWRHRE
jgi:fructan beta-fructosidase